MPPRKPPSSASPGGLFTPHPIGSQEAAEARKEATRLDAEARLAAVVERLDRWTNYSTGIGTFEDKTRHSHFEQPLRLTDAEITALASGNDLAAKAIEKRPREMFRRGYSLEPDGGDEIDKSKIEDVRKFAIEELQVDIRMRQGMVFGRQYGGSILILGINDGGFPWDPVDETRIKSIDFINQVDRRFAYVQSYYSDYMSPRYGDPETYLVANAVATSTYRSRDNTKFRIKKTAELPKGSNSAKSPSGGYSILNIHESRIIRFDGIEPDVLTRQQLAGWSWSILQRAYETLRLTDMGFDSLAYLLSDASQGVVKLKGLLKGLSLPGQKSVMEQRLRLVDESRSVARMIALDPDGGEDFTRVPTPFTGIPEAIDRLMQRLAASFDMPVTELFGISPAGLNATGQNDRIHWYDTIATDQENDLAPRLKRLYRLIALAKEGPLGGKDVNWKIHFNPLHSPSDAELSQTRFQNAQRDQLYVEMTAVTPQEVAANLSDVYPHLDIEAREEATKEGVQHDPFPNEPEPDPTGGAGTGGGIAEGQSPTVPLPGSALHTAASPAGEGQGTPGDAGTGNPRLGAAKQITPGQPKTRPAVPATANAASAPGQPGTKATVGAGPGETKGSPEPEDDDVPVGKGVPHVVIHTPEKGKPEITLHASKGKASGAAKDLAKKGGEAKVIPAAQYLAKQAAWAQKNPIHDKTKRFTGPQTKADMGHLLALDVPLTLDSGDRFDVGSYAILDGLLVRSDAAEAGVGAEPPVITPANDPQPEPLAAAAIGILRDGNRLLAVRATTGWRGHVWALPGGMLEPGESPEAALRRELAEEIGVVAIDIVPAIDILCPTDGRLVHVFFVRSWTGQFAPDRDEVRTLQWMTPAKLLQGSGRWRKSIQQMITAGLLPPTSSAPNETGPNAATERMLASAAAAAGMTEGQLGLHNTTSHADRADWRYDASGWDLGDEDALARVDSMTRTRSDGGLAREVFRQLLADYPAKSLGWVLAAHWDRRTIALDEIDTSNREKWTATKDGKVDNHVKRIEDGESPPVILVKPPNDAKYIIVDGHHRTLAFEKLGKTVDAYTAEVHVENGPWDSLHAAQKRGSSKSSYSVPSWISPNKADPTKTTLAPKADGTMVSARAGDHVIKGPAAVGALEDLLREHALLRRILAVYRQAAAALRSGGRAGVPIAALVRAAALFRSFGEDYHERAVEETHIFPVVMTELGDVVATLIGEHETGRRLTDAVLGFDAGARMSDPVFATSLENFASMYEHHAEVEEKTVFPAWAKALGAADLTRAGELFEAIEKAKLGPDGFDGAVREMDDIEGAFKSGPGGGGGGETPPSAKADAIGSASEEEQWLADNVTQAVVEALEAFVRDLPEDKTDWDESKHERDPKGMFTSGGGGVGAGKEAGTEHGAHGLRGALHAAIAKLRGAAGSIGRFAVDEVKEKIHEFKTAAQGVGNFIHGREVTREQGKAIKKVALSIAASILASHLTPLVPLAHVVHAELGVKVIEKVTDQALHHVIEFFGAKGLKLDSLLAAVALSAGGSEGSDPKAGSDWKDAGDWDELKHPRGPGGKFGAGGPLEAKDTPLGRVVGRPAAKSAQDLAAESKSIADAAMKETSLDSRNAKLQEAIDSLPGAPPLPVGYGPSTPEDPLMGAKSDEDFEARAIDRTSKVPVESQSAITAWTGHAYSEIRQYEADPEAYAKEPGDLSVSDVKTIDDRLQRAFDTAVPTPGLVYRGVSCALATDANAETFKTTNLQDDAKRLHALLTNDTIRLRTTASSSRYADTAQDFGKRGQAHVALRLKEKSGIAVEHLSQNHRETEVLLKKGTTFRITGRGQSAGWLIIDAEEI